MLVLLEGDRPVQPELDLIGDHLGQDVDQLIGRAGVERPLGRRDRRPLVLSGRLEAGAGGAFAGAVQAASRPVGGVDLDNGSANPARNSTRE